MVEMSAICERCSVYGELGSGQSLTQKNRLYISYDRYYRYRYIDISYHLSHTTIYTCRCLMTLSDMQCDTLWRKTEYGKAERRETRG